MTDEEMERAKRAFSAMMYKTLTGEFPPGFHEEFPEWEQKVEADRLRNSMAE